MRGEIKLKNISLMLLVFIYGLSINTFAEEKKRVFVLASYEKDHVCGGPQESGIIHGLIKQGWFTGLNLDVEYYYMDTKRKYNSADAIKFQAEIAIARIEVYKPQVIITIDDNAFREVGLRFARSGDVSVVFSGLNKQPEHYNKLNLFMNSRFLPGFNITGVYEKLYVRRSLEVIQRSIGNTEGAKVIGITDYSPTGNAITEQFDIELKNKISNINWKVKRVKHWHEYQALIKAINQDKQVIAIYPVALTLKASDNKVYTSLEIFEWTIKNSRKPEMALNYHFSKVGLFGGAAVDFRSMGFLAGKKAGKILNGKKAGMLSIDDAPDYAIVFNLKRAKNLGIKIPIPLLTAADHIFQ